MAEGVEPILGDRVRTAREERGYSQERLADLARVSRNAIYNLENIGTIPKADTLWRIAQATGRDMDWFFGVEDGVPPAPPAPPPSPDRVATERALRELEAAQARLIAAQEQLRKALTPPQPDRVAELTPDELAARRAARATIRDQVFDAAAAHEAEPGTESAENEFREQLADAVAEPDEE